MLLALAGLPGTGKSTLAAALAAALPGHVLSKDRLRATVFGTALDPGAEEDELCMGMIHDAAAFLLARAPTRVLIIDGRTYRRRAQVAALAARAASWRQPLRFVTCRCDPAEAKRRLAADVDHPARNRTPALYDALAAEWEDAPRPGITIDTGTTPVEAAVAAVRRMLAGRAPAALNPSSSSR